MKNIYTLLIAVLAMYSASAQDYHVIERFIILKAEHNGEDFSELYRANNARLVFYGDNVGNEYLANEWENSKSFGELHLIHHEHYKETKEHPSYTVYRYLWAYENTYDERKGFCFIKLRETYHEPATTFDMMMITDDFDVSGYKGYADGI